jgi:lysine 6-dehydrogenase
MSYTYAVLGAGRQGIAAAFDMARFGDADRVVIADRDAALAAAGAERVRALTGHGGIESCAVDVADRDALVALLEPVDALLSAVPYALNLRVARAAIAARTHMCDLGGNTDVTWAELALHEEACEAGISIVPDCGLQPGMGNTLAVHAMRVMSHPRDVAIYVGGLPLHPRPPFSYLLTFNIEGLTNEYDLESIVIQEGVRTALPAFSAREEIAFPEPVGRCEAFLTTGGTSTCPWTFEGQLDSYVEKTVRYPGHAAAFGAFRDLGLFRRDPLRIGDADIEPRAFYHALLEPLISYPDDPDIVVLRVICTGQHEGRSMEVVIEMMDQYDPATGFRAMERTTGWPAAIVSQLQARGMIAPGAVPLETSVPPAAFLDEIRRRDFNLTQTIVESGPI